MICGRNTMTLPTPEMTPFCRKLASKPSGSTSCTSLPSATNADDSNSITGCAQLNTAWNMTNRISARMIRPNTGCSTTASTRVISVSGFGDIVTVSRMIRSASRWVAFNSAMVSGIQVSSRVFLLRCPANSSVRWSSSAMPPLRTAIEVTTVTSG